MSIACRLSKCFLIQFSNVCMIGLNHSSIWFQFFLQPLHSRENVLSLFLDYMILPGLKLSIYSTHAS